MTKMRKHTVVMREKAKRLFAVISKKPTTLKQGRMLTGGLLGICAFWPKCVIRLSTMHQWAIAFFLTGRERTQ